ncbi:MAG TPA: N-acetylmuramic acid 6-phosphate etherase [Terriglobales bacterium]|nr:N-acetylmuramic acid 6-phosphate etherase [Terriglobales bacterium]
MKNPTPKDLAALATERRNRAAAELDTRSALEIARIINSEDAKVAPAVRRALPQIAKAIDLIVAALARGGRVIYVGTGTSGRIAALDASECPPTFNTDPETIQFVIAGGKKALGAAVEASEDSRQLGVRDIKRKRPGKNDVVVGLAASGRTPYTIAALSYARQHGAKTVAVTCARNSPLGKAAHVQIVAEVGPEVVAGSSRMKAGSAQKMILNMLSTGAMARLGRVYGNLMINVQLRNQKLSERGLGILQQAAGVDRNTAKRAVEAAGESVPVALVMLRSGVNRKEAERRLAHANGNARKAITGSGKRKVTSRRVKS